jgi:uncharacterized lipoprotein YmbA
LGLSIALAAAVAAGCASPPSHFYTLSPTAEVAGAAAAPYGVIVGPVSIPAAVDRPEFLVQVAPNRVDVDAFHRWAAPLNDAIAGVVAQNLAALLGTPDVATAPLANFKAKYRVTIDVQRFDSLPGQEAVLDAVWAVRQTGGETRSGRTVAREAVHGEDFAALAAAHSQGLAQLSSDIAAAIRTSEATP